MAGENAHKINQFMIGAIVILGQIVAFMKYGGVAGEAIGYGIGLVILPLVAHFLIAKLDTDHKENMRKLLRAGIIDAILLGVVAYSTL